MRAPTRRPDAAAAQALAALGIEVALAGAAGLCLTTTPYEGGVDEEERHAAAAIDAAQRVGIDHLVYSSVACADRPTGVAHFESKGRIERMLDDVSLRAVTILRPTFFMEMLLSPRFRKALDRGRIEWMPGEHTPIAMVSIGDIAAFALLAFDQPTAAELVATLAQILSRPIAYRQVLPVDVADDAMPRLVTQRWIEEMGWRIDVDALATNRPVPLTSFNQCAVGHRAALLETDPLT